MSETGFTCPRCGNTKYFTAFAVVLTGKTFIHPDGWNYFDSPNDVELAPNAMMRCEECEYTAIHHEFEEEE